MMKLSEAEKKQRGYKLKSRYGISWEEYERLFKAQRGKCAICGKMQVGKLLAVDHRHGSNPIFIRGLLCTACNTFLLKTLRDNKRVARGLVEYLTKAIKNDKKWRE